ncbi:processed acidic surface protein [Pseudalkalibacillus sp. SCS-8]|uniref:processed acidic surface protein n=1 Tax=Pseudalkalibacillus nanhaiensis TaxID=3115291 RepID=UPI0032DA2109
MKHVLAIVFSITVLLVPMSALAAIEQSELDAYLEQIGWTQEELEEELAFFEMTLADFDSIEMLQEFIGTPLSEENLQSILDDFDLTREELNGLLVEMGELEEGEDVLDVYTIYEYLRDDVEFYLYEGTPIDEESLNELLTIYELTYEELIALLEENGDSIEQYEYIEDLEEALFEYMYGDEIPTMDDFFTELGITEEELDALMNHLMTIDIDDPAIEEKMDALTERLLAIGDFENPEDLTKDQVAEMAAIMSEMLALFQLDAKFYLIVDGKTEPITINQLLAMSEEEVAGTKLLVEIYDLNGTLLLDMLLTEELVEAEKIQEAAEDLKVVEEIVTGSAEQSAEPSNASPVTKTVKGAKMPKTAGHYMEAAMLGIGFVLAGLMMIRRLRQKTAA